MKEAATVKKRKGTDGVVLETGGIENDGMFTNTEQLL